MTNRDEDAVVHAIAEATGWPAKKVHATLACLLPGDSLPGGYIVMKITYTAPRPFVFEDDPA